MTVKDALASRDECQAAADRLLHGLVSGDTPPSDFGDQLIASTVDDLGHIIRRLGVSRPILIVDAEAFKASGIRDRLASEPLLSDATVFDRIRPNPTHIQAMDAVQARLRAGADSVVSIGGGSCIDVAKIAAVGGMSADERSAIHPAPHIAVPTTAGTGSEATHFSVIYRQGVKTSIADQGMRPRAVVLDESLLASTPRPVATAAALDALCQGLESIWAVAATEQSRYLGERAATIIREVIEPAILQPSQETRSRMLVAAHLAGRAIDIGKTTGAHALSYALTSKHNLPHGIAVALMFPSVAMWNARVSEEDCNHPHGAAWVRERVADVASVLGCRVDEFRTAWRGILAPLGISDRLADHGISKSEMLELAAHVDPARGSNNPRRLSAEIFDDLL